MIRQGKSAYLRRAQLNEIYGAQALAAVGTIYLALFSARHNADGSGGTELSGAGYARLAITNNLTSWPDSVDNEKDNGIELAFAAATLDWARAVAFAFYDNVSAGNQLHFGELIGEALVFTVDAATDVFTSAAHGYIDGTRVRVYNRDGNIPTGLAEATVYYIRDATANTFKLAATSGGAAINITAAGDGAHYVAEDKSKLVEAGDIARFLANTLKIREY